MPIPWKDMSAEKRERILASTKKWRKSHPETVMLQHKRRYQRLDKEKAKMALREWRKKNPGRVSEHNRRARKKLNPLKKSEYQQKWERNNPDKARAKCVRRRARKANASINRFTGQQWSDVKAAYGFKCAYCHLMKPLSMDHVIPLFRGGDHCVSNIVPACRSCNSKKGTREAPSFQPALYI